MGNITAGGQLSGKGGLYRVKAGHQTAAMLGHVCQHAFLIFQEADMAQLVHLVIADDHRREALAHVLHRVLAAGNGRHTGTREGDLAGGGEHKDAVLIAVLFGLIQQDRGLNDLLGQVMDDIRLIPENLEIRGSGLEGSKAADRLIAVGVAVRVGILRHAPDTLDGVILGNQLLDHVHIGTIGAHGDADQLKAHLLGDGKVAVIAGHRAEELALLYLTPRLGRILKAEHHADRDQIVHQLQAGVAAHKDLVCLDAEHIGKKLAGLLQPLKVAVVAHIGAVGSGVIIKLEQVHGQIHLVRAGLAAGHIQLQAHCLKFLVLFFQSFLFSSQFVASHLKIICHNTHSFIVLSVSHKMSGASIRRAVPCQWAVPVFPLQFQTFIVYYNLVSETSQMAQKSPAKKQKAFSGAVLPCCALTLSSGKSGSYSACAPHRTPCALRRPPRCPRRW